MKLFSTMLIGSLWLIPACQPADLSKNAEIPVRVACTTDVSAQDIRGNDKGRALAGDIFLADIVRTDTTIGYGPALNPKAEITIVDGVYYLTQPEREPEREGGEESTQTRNEPVDGQGATFLVHASPRAWHEAEPLPQAGDLAALSRILGIAAVKMGCTGEAVFPFKIEGRAAALTWSITGEPKGMKGELADVDITIVGIFDNSGLPKNAIMSGLNIHPHVVIKSENASGDLLSGHLNAVQMMPGAKLFVPLN